MNLSGSEDEGGKVTLKVNKTFANYYEKARRSEELMKLKARYGDVSLNKPNDDSDSETEDEDAEELTPAVEQKWLKTLAALKSNDPRIYDSGTKFFGSEDEEAGPSQVKKKSKKQKRLTLKDMDRKVIMEREGQYSENSSDEEIIPLRGPGYYEEQEEIRKSIKKAQEDVSSDSEDGNLLTVKVKTEAEKAAEEAEYLKFIKGQEAEVDEKDMEDLSGLRDYWNREEMTDADKFLKDYILNKRYLAEESSADDEKEDEDSDSAGGKKPFEFQDLSDDEQLDNAEQFELKYNFRFEEPDPEFIKSFPRTIESTMRADKNTRRDKRAKLRERKDDEKKKKREELNRLKNLKRKEIEDKLHAIMEKSGASNMPFTSEELDEDFDPDEHDKKMQEMFPDDDLPEDDGDSSDLAKPQFEYDPEIDDAEDWDKYQVGSGSHAADEHGQEYVDIDDPSFNMDADYDPNAATLNDRNFGLDGKSKKSRRKKNRLRKALEKKKPLFDPNDKTFEEYLDEYYGLECEDMIGDMRCRFPYREVPANDFGLSAGEILKARDKELNSWSSLKKTVQYRSDKEEYKDVSKFRRKAKDLAKKKRLLPSLFRDQELEETTISLEPKQNDVESGTEQSNKEELPSTNDQGSSSLTINTASGSKKSATSSKKRKAKWKAQEIQSAPSTKGMTFKRMEAYGLHGEVKRVKKLRARDKKKRK